MGIDRKTPIVFSIWMDNNKELLKKLEKAHIECVGEEDHKKENRLIISSDLGTINTEEYYFEDSDSSIHYSGSIGDTSINFDIPLSDEVLIDVLQHSIKRLNKLKTALETLK